MLTPHLQKTIDDKWDNCWPVSNLRPLAILDLISYVFFIKKLDDRELINKKLQLKQQGDNFIYTEELEEFTWSSLKNMDVQRIHNLFIKKHGLINLMMQYGHSNFLYSDFFKAPLLLTPTPKLIFNVIEIINIIETSDKNTQASIIEYLFSKAQITGQNGHEFIPEYLSRLIVSIAEPAAKDVTWDPAAGNGSLLINADRYITNRSNVPAHTLENNASAANGSLLKNSDRHIENRYNSPVHTLENETSAVKLKGMESDLIQLRLAAMNMMLHDIENPNLEFLPGKNLNLPENPTLIISNLLFTDVEIKTIDENSMPQPGNLGKEIVLLTRILENLQPGSRAVIMVPEILLKSITPEIKKIRQHVIDNYNLEGVINLPQKSGSIFSGASILIFNRYESITTNNIWFCKMGNGKEKGSGNKQRFNNGDQTDVLLSTELYEVNNILNKWKNREDTQINNQDIGFYIPANAIKANDYNLNFNDYKLIRKDLELNKKAENSTPDKNTIVAAKKENLHHFFEDSIPLQETKPKRKILSTIILLLVLIAAGIGIYFFNFKTNTFNFFSTGKLTDTVSNINITKSSNQSQAETTKINKPVPAKNLPASAIKVKNLNAPLVVSKGYTVITKAFFYSEPDISKQKSLYLQPRKDIILNATAEQNGFVYIVYINKKGQATKGWLNKKDLQPVE